MPTRFIQRSPQAAAAWTGSHAGIGVDSDDDRLYVNIGGIKRPISTDGTAALTATNTLTAAQSGSKLFLNSATEFVTTLPALAAGLEYDIYVKAAPSGASYTVVTSGSANVMLGQVIPADGAAGDTEASGGDTYTFVDGAAVKGDHAKFVCDGTNWYVTGYAAVATGATITTAS